MIKTDYSKILVLLKEMRLPVMAEQLGMIIESNEIATITNYDLLDRLVSEESISRANNTIARNKKKAKLSQPSARLSEIDYSPERRINEAVIRQLSTNDFIEKARNVIILGACGTGKSYLSNALAVNACEARYTAYYCRTFELLSDIRQHEMLGDDMNRYLKKYIKPDLLILDDFLISSITEKDAINLYKIQELRYGHKSTIIASQLEPKEWHKRLGGTIMADSILDRILPNSYKIILSGDSLRNKK